jgi:hypothetical protein
MKKDRVVTSDVFSRAELGLYKYATRMFAKANPFHLFSGTAVSSAMSGSETAEVLDLYEVILDESLLQTYARLALDATDPVDVGYVSLSEHGKR